MSLGPLMVGIKSTELDEVERELLCHPSVGGVILFTRNYESLNQLEALVTNIHALRKPNLLVAVDQEGGRVQRFRDGFSTLPAIRELGKRYDLDHDGALQQAERWGWLMAAELRAIGIDMSFAPILDIDRKKSQVIGDRAFHSDSAVISRLSFRYMRGMHNAGMSATAKHFPGHGGVSSDTHTECAIDDRSFEAIVGDDIRPFNHLIESDLAAVMMSHVIYSQVDRWPASLSAVWIQQILRKRLGFQGVIFSDDLCMEGCGIAGSMIERTRKALDAGCDMVLICNDFVAIAEVVSGLECSSDPLATSRLARLHGHKALNLKALHHSLLWQQARDALAGDTPPPLQLS
ncbi:MAG: beta-N-acetylhexosaminidase [Gammaproteobacteria bacterium]|nr:beta-N-acetylhexosaminidase [Gammaproteobacteria bacterium]PCH64069.1 MAG: beta-N-acetylhexosaminidase [Gammaproteobacteria bacterium]